MSSVLKTGEDVVQLLHPAVQLANQIVTISGRIDAEILVSMSNVVQNLSDSNATSMATLREWLGNNNATLNLINSNQKETIARIDSLKDSLEGKVQKDHRLKVLEWLSSIPYERHHKKALDEVLHGTGLWFLEDEEYRHWRDSDQNAVLWVHGIPGSGKSKLVYGSPTFIEVTGLSMFSVSNRCCNRRSLAIQQALDSSDDTSSSLYFYCSRTSAEPERAKAEDIVRCLVKQLSTGKDSNQPTVIPPYVNEKFEESEARGFASGELMFDESCDLISKFATDKDRTFILFDAFDECEEDARYSLIEALNALMQRISTSLVKILISSRDDLHLKTFFDNHLTYENHIETRNQQDIDLYVKSQLKQLIKQKRIVVGGKAPSPSLQDFIITKLCAGSQGM
ncbi:hypothetical protein MMC28_001019 [Mycoblastus sanguinarius]|nr:hypothetical protein [Mycoblastus sanguinarius]